MESFPVSFDSYSTNDELRTRSLLSLILCVVTLLSCYSENPVFVDFFLTMVTFPVLL